MHLVVVLSAISKEVEKASAKHKPMNSHHEAHSVIAEEFDEYWTEVKKKGGATSPRDLAALQLELIHTAAMCVRALQDLC